LVGACGKRGTDHDYQARYTGGDARSGRRYSNARREGSDRRTQGVSQGPHTWWSVGASDDRGRETVLSHFVTDCSVTMAWCFEDEANDYTDAILQRLLYEEAIVPSLWPLEVSNVLLVGERQKRITQAETTKFIGLLNALPIVIDEETSRRALTEIL